MVGGEVKSRAPFIIQFRPADPLDSGARSADGAIAQTKTLKISYLFAWVPGLRMILHRLAGEIPAQPTPSVPVGESAIRS